MECFKEEEKYTNIKLYSLLSDNTDEQLNCIKNVINNDKRQKIYFFKIESDTFNEYEIGIAIKLDDIIEIYRTNLNCDRIERAKEIESLVEFVESLLQTSKMNKEFFIIPSDKCFNFQDFNEINSKDFYFKLKEIPYSNNQILDSKTLKEFLCNNEKCN